MTTSSVILALTKVFIIIIPAYILAKRNVIKKNHTEGFSSLLTNFTYPCMILSAMQMEFSMEVLKNCGLVVVIFFVVSFAAILISKGIVSAIKMPGSQSGIMAFMMIFGNTGFVGVAVINGLLGKEGVFYAVLCDVTMDVLLFTIGIALIRQAANSGEKMSVIEVLKCFINPCFICVIIGMSMYVLRISLPEIILGPLESVGNVTGPMAMIIVGTHLAQIDIREMLVSRYSYIVSFLKLIISPIAALILVKLIIGSVTLFGSVLVMEAAMPCAMFTVILSERYRADIAFATKGVMLSTLLSVVTIPLMAVVMQFV